MPKFRPTALAATAVQAAEMAKRQCFVTALCCQLVNRSFVVSVAVASSVDLYVGLTLDDFETGLGITSWVKSICLGCFRAYFRPSLSDNQQGLLKGGIKTHLAAKKTPIMAVYSYTLLSLHLIRECKL